MDINTLETMFRNLFDRDEIVSKAREVGALSRLRDIHPMEFSLAVTGCAIGDETRSIACARRLFDRLARYMPEESSFYGRFNAGSAALMRDLFLKALNAATEEKRQALAEALGGSDILDLWATDATQIALPASAAEVFPATNDDRGGLKLTATLSVLFQQIKRVEVTCARQHDRKALRLPRWLHGVLLLLDMGYFDHRLFADVEDRCGYFLTPLKENSFPHVVSIRRGLGQSHVGKSLDGSLPYRGVVDLDARFNVSGGKNRVFRVVRVPVTVENNGVFEQVHLWFVTNLPAERFSAEVVATLYRYRWEVEQLFRTLKTVGRLDQLRSSKPEVIHTFLYATLLGIVLAQDICAQMRRARPDIEPSLYRVLALLLGYLPDIVESIGTERFVRVLHAFERALWREGANPNPGRHYKSSIYAKELCNVA
jgi:hypothetical protein